MAEKESASCGGSCAGCAAELFAAILLFLFVGGCIRACDHDRPMLQGGINGVVEPVRDAWDAAGETLKKDKTDD